MTTITANFKDCQGVPQNLLPVQFVSLSLTPGDAGGATIKGRHIAFTNSAGDMTIALHQGVYDVYVQKKPLKTISVSGSGTLAL